LIADSEAIQAHFLGGFLATGILEPADFLAADDFDGVALVGAGLVVAV
jgi:hypothetical protein